MRPRMIAFLTRQVVEADSGTVLLCTLLSEHIPFGDTAQRAHQPSSWLKGGSTTRLALLHNEIQVKYVFLMNGPSRRFVDIFDDLGL